jgi:hypothetical protein
MFRADFLTFTSKIVEHSRHLPPVFQKSHRQRRKKTPQEGRSAEKWEAGY